MGCGRRRLVGRQLTNRNQKGGVASGRWCLTVTLLLVTCFGCESGPRGGGTVVRDSAGVRVVESTAATEFQGGNWTITTVPARDLGVVEGASPFVFQYVVGATRLDDGRVIVADAGFGELRCFGPDGDHEWTVGGLGEGPGEFRVLDWVRPFGPDSLVAYDRSLRRLTVFDRNGAVGRTVNVRPAHSALRPTVMGVLADGSLVVRAAPSVTPNTVSPGVNQWEELVLRYTQGGQLVDTIAKVLGSEYLALVVEGRRNLLSRPFGRHSVIAVSFNRVYVAYTGDYTIAEYDFAGTLTRLVRLVAPDRPVTDAHRERYAQEWLTEIATDNERNRIRRLLEVAPFPDALPAFSSILIDADGYLWVEDSRVPAEVRIIYSVFDVDRGLMARVEIPEGLRVYEVGRDYVLGRWQDSLDVAHVRLHELTRR
jgi:hypothetical protein